MKTRVFYTKHVLVGSTANPTYQKTQHQEDFDLEPQEAYKRLLKTFGAVTDSKETAVIMTGERTLVAPKTYITINSHTFIDPDREVVRLPEERVYEATLFPAEFYKETLSRKPE